MCKEDTLTQLTMDKIVKKFHIPNHLIVIKVIILYICLDSYMSFLCFYFFYPIIT